MAGSNNTPLTRLPVYENESPPALFTEVDNLVIFGKADMSWQEKAARELWLYKRELPRQGVASHNQVLLDAAGMLFEQGDFSRAADHLQALCDREPQHSWLQLHLAEALLRSHRPLPRTLLNTLRTQFSHSRRFQALERAATQRA
jgi:predicted Zn-dependent protease